MISKIDGDVTMTPTWILILTMMGASGAGVAIEHIHGFASKQECDVAARKWKDGFDESLTPRAAVCVEQSGKVPGGGQ